MVAEVVRTVDRQAGIVRSRVISAAGADTVEVVQTGDGARVTYATELRYPYLTALVGVWLMHGRFERGLLAQRSRCG